MSAEHDAVRPLLGGYVLGGLDDADEFRVDAHLSACADCRAEVERLAPVPELLQRLPADPVPGSIEDPSRAGLDALLRRTRPVRRRRGRVLAGVAAVLVVLVAAGFLLLPRSSLVRQAAPGPSATASPSASAVPGTIVLFVAAGGSALSGRATLTPRQWGVSVALELSGLPGDGPFVLHVLGRGGQAEQAACWGRTATGSARVTGASSIQLANLDKVTVSDYDGHLLGSAAQR